MAEVTIDAMNEVIARFAEIKTFDDSRYGILYVSPADGKTCFSLRYHCSWDWLRPVWVTIEEFHHNLHIAIQWYNDNQQKQTNG